MNEYQRSLKSDENIEIAERASPDYQSRSKRLRGLAQYLGASLVLEDTWVLNHLPKSMTEIGFPHLDLGHPTNFYKCSLRGGLDEVEFILLAMCPEVEQ